MLTVEQGARTPVRCATDPDLAGMGTTLTGGYSLGANLFLAHVGDSRAYLFRGGKLSRSDLVPLSHAGEGHHWEPIRK